jgi:predicted dehydrogenase
MPYEFVICGAGNAGVSIGKVATEDGRGKVVGLFEPVEGQLAKAQALFPDARAEGVDYERLLDETKPDAVAVAGPDHLHADQAIAALERGCHVIIEKPLATTAVDAGRIIEAADAAGRHVMTDHTLRFAYPYRQMALAAKSGEVGTIFTIQGDYIHDMWDLYNPEGGHYTPWRVDPDNPQDILLGGGIHSADLMLWTVESPVEEVFCYANKMSAPEFPTYDCYTLVFRFESGATGRLLVSSGCSGHAWHHGHPDRDGMGGGRLVIYGTEGSLWRGTLYRRGEEPVALEDTSSISVVGGHAWGAAVRAYLDLLEGKGDNPTTAREGARAVALCEAAMESARTGQPQRPVWFE